MIVNPFKRYPVIVRHLGELAEWFDSTQRAAAAAARFAEAVPTMQQAAECYPEAERAALEAINAKLGPEVLGELGALHGTLKARAMLALETCIVERQHWGDPDDDRPPGERA